jgi:hypothetical protein
MLIWNEWGQDGQNHDANIKTALLVWAYCYIIGSQLDNICDQGLPHPDKGSLPHVVLSVTGQKNGITKLKHNMCCGIKRWDQWYLCDDVGLSAKNHHFTILCWNGIKYSWRLARRPH